MLSAARQEVDGRRRIDARAATLSRGGRGIGRDGWCWSLALLLLVAACGPAASTGCQTDEARACTVSFGAEGLQFCSAQGEWGRCVAVEGQPEPDVSEPDGVASLPLSCAPDCVGKLCGGDGCGGSCGACGTGEFCSEGGTTCAATCDGTTCGAATCCDRTCCGDECCVDGQACVDHSWCCTPRCEGRVCGDDGCGGSCGGCAPGCACVLGACDCCDDECAEAGRRRCAETGWQECGRFDDDGCLEWSAVHDCGEKGCDPTEGQCLGCQSLCWGHPCGQVQGCYCGTCSGCASSCVDGKCRATLAASKACHGADLEWQDSCGAWQGQLAEDCACGCVGGSCLRAVCTPGAARCNGDRRETCAPDGCSWKAGPLCDCGCVGGACATLACSPGQETCQGGLRRRCDADGCGWSVTEACACGCDGGACATTGCSQGARRCSGDDVERCSDGCSWTFEQACAHGCATGACSPAPEGATIQFVAPASLCTNPVTMSVAVTGPIVRVTYAADGWSLGQSTAAGAGFPLTYAFQQTGQRVLRAVGFDAANVQRAEATRTVVVNAPAPDPGELPNVPYFYQYDNDLSPGSTCQNTSVAMLLAYYGWTGEPDTITSAWGKDYAQSPAGLAEVFNSYAAQMGIPQRLKARTNGTVQDVRALLAEGKPVIVHGYFTSYGHVLVTLGYDGASYTVNDPAGKWSQQFKGGYPYGYNQNGGHLVVYGKAAFEAAIATSDGASFLPVWYHELQ